MKDTIVLDLRKVSDENGFDKAKDLFGEIHENTDKENYQLEKDLFRSKIIIDDNGKRIECSSIQEFLDNSQSLTADQQQYILNMSHQGLMGGGSTSIPITLSLHNKYNAMLFDPRNIGGGNPDDVQLCVSIKGNSIKFINTINFNVQNADNSKELYEDVMLSLVADLSNLEKGKVKDMPLHMMISSADKRIDVIEAIREVQGEAEEKDQNKVTEVANVIQEVRENKRKDNVDHQTKLLNNPAEIRNIAFSALDINVTQEERQSKLTHALRTNHLQIEQNDRGEFSTIQEMEAKIYHHLTSGAPDKEAKRMQFGAQKVIEYISAFEGENGIKTHKPSANVVSSILSSLTDDKSQQKIIQKNAPMILRQVIDTKNLSFGDRVKKLFDTVTMAIMFDGKGVKQMVKDIKIIKDPESAKKPSHVELVNRSSNNSKLRSP